MADITFREKQMKIRAVSAAVLGLLYAVNPPAAQAQKAEDTIRLAINDPFNVLDSYTVGQEEANTFNRTIYQHLIAYDEYKKKWVPILAKSFRRIDPKTLEFELRDNVKFHNGNPFDASDVKYMADWVTHPDSKVVFKDRYSWIKQVEILSPHKIRLHSAMAFSTDLGALAYRFRIYDKETHEALADKADYGKTGIGTGPYRLVSLDRNKGVVTERIDNYYGDEGYYRAPVRRVHAIPIPDAQTRVAQLLTGGIDLMRNIGPDEAKNLSGNPNLGITVTDSGVLLYVTFDVAGRSSNKVMMDERVRKAFIMAIDTDLLVKNLIPGGDKAHMAKAICLPSVFGCAPTTEPYKFNPTEAKRLLAEAGYPNGLDLTLHVHATVRNIAEAIAGEVRKVGFRASIESMPLSVYVKKRGDGEFTTFVNTYPTYTHPDMATLWDFFFNGERDYWHDPFIEKTMTDGNLEFDDAKRTALYTPALDLINRKAYILPISEMPMLWAHQKDVVVMPDTLSASSPVLGDFAWKQ
jgi:peptide/nickel transport system substrate-binding protein